MAFLSLSSLLILAPAAWPQDPIATEFSIGKALASSNKPLESVLGKEQVGIGKWTDGLKPKEVEQAVFLTPELVSRWMGWLCAKESWDGTTLADRWNQATFTFGKRPIAALKLALFERVDALEFADIARPNPSQLDAVEVRWKAADIPGYRKWDLDKGTVFVPGIPGSINPCGGRAVVDEWSTNPKDLVAKPWWTTASAWQCLWPATYRPQEANPLKRGWNRLCVYRVELPFQSWSEVDRGGTLQITKAAKQLAANLPSIAERKKPFANLLVTATSPNP